MKRKSIIIFVALMVLLVGVASASEVSDDTIDTPSTGDTSSAITSAGTDSDVMSHMDVDSEDLSASVTEIQENKKLLNNERNTKTEGEPIDVSDYKTLKDILEDDAYPDVSINIVSNITLENTTYLNLKIKTLKIEGNGKTIDGNNQYRFLFINESTVTINNLNIINCRSTQYGGAIYNAGGNLTITRSNFTNCRVEKHGAALYNRFHGNVTIMESNFKENHVDEWGGAIFTWDGSMKIINSNLTDNHAGIYGGAVYVYGGFVNITDSNLTDNHADTGGGAVYNAANLTITNSTLRYNNATNGGAIWNNKVIVITDSNLTENRADQLGGAIFNKKTYEGGILTIINSNITKNNATISGGGIYNNDTANVTIETTNINNNNAVNGGAINNKNGTINITDNSYLNNNNALYGGAILNNYGTITITNTNLNNNNATQEGGAIRNYQGTLILEDNTNLTYNNAMRGGAISNFNGTMNIKDNTNINNNNATYYGGAIFNYNEGTINITNTNLTNNNAIIGGAISNNNGTMNIKDNTNLTYNNATDGGAIYNYNEGTIIINNTNINNNTARWGGAIFNTEGTLNITNTNLNNNSAKNGGAIHNEKATITITNTNLNNNSATNGGAIDNYAGTLTVTNSSMFEYNRAVYGGAICINGTDYVAYLNVSVSNFTNNNASYGAAIYSTGNTIGNITYNNFTENTADNNETIDLYGNKSVDNNAYHSTDISLKTINLTVKDNREIFQYEEDVELIFSIELTTQDNYDSDILEKIDKTIFINNTENATTNSTSYTLSNPDIGKYVAYYTTCNQESDIANFKVIGDSKITTDKESYDYYDGINNKITLSIIDDSGEKGTIDVYVKDGEEYADLSSYFNIKDEYTLSTKAIAERLENLYGNLNSSYSINITYYSDFANTSSTEFTLNIIKLRNTTIVYDILNRTEGNVQINITVIDTVYKSPIPDARIEITGDITENTTSGVLTNDTLTEGDYTINVRFNETEVYNPSETTINFNVEIDKDAKIVELNDTINNLTQKLNDAYAQIEFLNNTAKNLTEQLKNATDKIESLNENITELKEQLNSANEEIKNLNDTNKDLKDELTQANDRIKLLEDKVNNLTDKLNNANTQIDTLNDLVDNLTEQLNCANEEIKNLNDTNKDLNDQLTQANDRIKLLEDKVNNLTDKLNDANKQIDTLNDVVDDLTGQLDNANEEIENLEDANSGLNDQLDQANEKIKSLNSTVNKLTKQLNDANSQIDTLNDLVDELTEQLNAANNEIEVLKDTNKDLNSQLTQANDMIKSLDNEVDKLTEQLDNADKEINELMDIIDELLNKQPINTTITINPIKFSVGSIATLTANIVDVNGNKVSGGKAVFKVNGITLKDKTGNVIYARVSDGLASIQYKVQDVWMKDTSYVESVYSGDDNYTSSRTKSTDALQITQGISKITLDEDTITAMSGETITLRAKVTDSTGDRINTGKVVFKLNGKTLKDENGNTLYAKVTDGEATLDYTIPAIYSAKTYSLTAVFGGGNYERSETTGTLTLERKDVNIKENSITTVNGKTTIKATITDITGKLLVTSTKLAFKINGKTILNGVNSTDGKINVSFVTTLRPGTYELEIISGENSIYKKGTLTTVLKI